MSHPKQINSEQILAAALQLLETDGPDALSLRGLASRLQVKAPSLYRYFADKSALEVELVAEGSRRLLAFLSPERSPASPEEALRALANDYLHFARQHASLYFFMMQQAQQPDSSPAGKQLWNLLLTAIGRVTGNPDDTNTAVALWSFLHGFAALEHSGRFGKSGPKAGFETGIEAILHAAKTGSRANSPQPLD